MTEYKGIKGGKVQNFDTDPDNPYVGQVWYNQTLGDLRVRATTLTSAWSTGGSLNTGRFTAGAAGTQTAGLAFGGYNPSTAASTVNTEKYDGSTWTEVNNMNTARTTLAGSGTQTSALAYGGFSTDRTGVTESYDGTSWTEVNDLNH